MKQKLLPILIFGCCLSLQLQARVAPDRVKAWLQLDQIKQKMQENIAKYSQLQASVKNESNGILEQSIDAADQLAQDDPVAAYALYHDMQKFKNKTRATDLDIESINKKFQEISDYVDLQVRQLKEIRRKHLQFPC